MPSTENTTLHLIQQEIQDVMERERELKKYYRNNNNNINNNNNSISECSTEDEKDTELGSSIKSDDSEENQIDASNANGNGYLRPPLLRAKSTSVLEQDTQPKPNFRRVVSSNPSTKGVMQRFLKSRGKLQVIAALSAKPVNGNTTSKSAFKGAFNGPSFETFEIPAHIKPGQHVRRNFISAEQKIQQDIADTYKREAELKTLRQSQGNLAGLSEDDLDAPLPNYMGGLRASKSMAHLYNSNENIDNTASAVSAPCSLKPAKSLAQLCDAKDEEVTSSQTLIMRFEQMIIKNQESKRT